MARIGTGGRHLQPLPALLLDAGLVGSHRKPLEAAPHITVLRDDAGKPVLLLPLVRKRVGPLHVGFFMGGKHTNFNLPVWRPELLKNQPRA